jgi:hypothetical protein
MRALAVTPVTPRVSRRGSAWWTPKIVQHDSSPRMSSQVPAATPVGCAVRWAVQSEGVTWRTKATVSSVPRPARPATVTPAIRSATQPLIRTAGRVLAGLRRVSMIVSVPASSVAEAAGTSAVQ